MISLSLPLGHPPAPELPEPQLFPSLPPRYQVGKFFPVSRLSSFCCHFSAETLFCHLGGLGPLMPWGCCFLLPGKGIVV